MTFHWNAGNYTVNILGKSSGPYSSHLKNMAVRSLHSWHLMAPHL